MQAQSDVTLQEEVVNYTFETVADGIPIPWEWLAGRLHVGY
jgi:hypothetical protein